MFKRPEFRIKSEDFQALVNDFTLGMRDWTSYSSGKLDHILHFQMKNRINNIEKFMYSRFDAGSNELVFVGEPVIDDNQFELISGQIGIVVSNPKLLSPAAEARSEANAEARTEQQESESQT